MKLLLEITKEDLDEIDLATRIHITQLNMHNPDVSPKTDPWHRLLKVRKHIGLSCYYDSQGNVGSK